MSLARVILAVAVALLSTRASALPSCDSLDECIARMRSLAKSPGGNEGSLNPDERELIRRTIEFDGAVARLVPLLASPDRQLAKLASASLRDATAIDAKYFPQITAGLDRGLGWLPPALCAMPGEAPAREAVARFLVSKDAPGNQEAFAVERCGTRALPFIAEAAKCIERCPPSTHAHLAYVLGEMDPKVSVAIAAPLLQMIRDPHTPDRTARGVLAMIGALGKPAVFLQQGLLELRSQRPSLATAIDDALVDLHANTAGPIAAHRLSEAQAPSPFGTVLILRDIAELRADGRDAGVEVVKLLRSEDWETRVAAARTLGFIDYQPAAPLLIQAISDPSDVRLNWVAVESLGRLRNETALEPLQNAANRHWYTPVRRAATEAMGHIRAGTSYVEHAGNFPFDFFAYQNIAERSDGCPAPAIAPLPEERARKLRATADDVAKLAHRRRVDTDVAGRKPRTVVEIPELALRVANGWMTGTDHGEWGGELVFIGDDRSQRLLLEANVHDIFMLEQRILVLTGLAHLGMNHGMILELRQDTDGNWTATPWRALPGAPERARLMESGELAIDVIAGGSILVAPDGSMRMACGAQARTS